MPDPVTNNVSLTLPTIGGDVGTWGTPLNGDITSIDALFGASFSTAITAADVTLTTTQFQNGIFVVTGTLTGNRNLIVPLSTNSSTTACGGKFIVVNNGAGAFNLSVKTATTGLSAVVPQGFAASLYSDGANVKYASDDLPGYALASNGTPSGTKGGTAGSVNTNASIAYDYTNNKLYMCTVSSTTAATYTLPITAAVAPTFYTPDVQVFTSGVGATYTAATNGGNRALYLRVRMVGGGGGGGAATSNAGSDGADTSFASWVAAHGTGGAAGDGTTNGGLGGTGGASSTGTQISRIGGGNGGSGHQDPSGGIPGGYGGVSYFGGGSGSATPTATGRAAAANSGSGGGGGVQGSSVNGGGGGGSGEFVEFIITSPAATYTYTVGTGGNGGAAGNTAGGNGAAGRIEVIGYWQ